MPDEKQQLFQCPECGLPFKTEDNLSFHVANWHRDESSGKRENQKQIDPAELLWHDLIRRVYKSPRGFQDLSEPEKRYFAVCIFEGEVYNGGFHQYFFNNSGTYYEYTLFGLQEMNALKSLDLLQRAKHAIFNDENIPVNRGKRREYILQGDSESRSKLLGDLTRKFWQDPDNLGTKIIEYAKLQGLL